MVGVDDGGDGAALAHSHVCPCGGEVSGAVSAVGGGCAGEEHHVFFEEGERECGGRGEGVVGSHFRFLRFSIFDGRCRRGGGFSWSCAMMKKRKGKQLAEQGGSD